jgi:hypothetical protein
MVIKVEALKTEVKYMGIFYFKGFYRAVVEYLKDIDYTDQEKFKYLERYYYEKRSLDPAEAKSNWIWVRTNKYEEGATFFHYTIDLDYHIRYMKDVEIMRHGQKFTAQKGEVSVVITANMIVDPYDKWKNHWFLKHILEFYLERLWRQEKEMHKNIVKGDAYKLQAMMKRYFEMQTFMGEKDEFFPSHGVRDEKITA